MKLAEGLSLLMWPEEKEAGNDGLAPVYVRITITGFQRKEFSTGIKVDPNPKLWDSDDWRVKGKSDDVMALNDRIEKVWKDLKRQYETLRTQNEIVTPEMLKKAYKDELAKRVIVRPRTLCQAYNYKYSIFAHQVKKKLRSGNTLRKLRSTKVKLRHFLQSKYKKWDINLSDVTLADAEDFFNYLTLQEDLEENTSWKYLKSTKELLKIGTDKKWIQENPWDKYPIRYDSPNRDILSMPDINNLYHHELIGRLDYVRDISLFAIFTGYAYCELDSFQKTDIFKGDDGKRWIKIDRKKTGAPTYMPLLPIPAAIVDKYWNDTYCLQHGKLLPLRSYQHYNGYLKELANICQLSIIPTPHELRHTFATTVCLDHGVPLETVQVLLGHKDIRATMIYARVSRNKVKQNMQQLERELFGFDGQLKEMPNTVVEFKLYDGSKAA
jgi:site-specific recombinase XerD